MERINNLTIAIGIGILTWIGFVIFLSVLFCTRYIEKKKSYDCCAICCCSLLGGEEFYIARLCDGERLNDK